jgi:hypothetical protein
MLRDWMSTFRGEATANPYGATASGSDLLADRIAGRIARFPQDAGSRRAPAGPRPAPTAPAKRPG